MRRGGGCMAGIGGCGTGKSGISPNEEASEAAEEVVSGREEGPDKGENGSSLVNESRYCGESCCIGSSSDVGRGGR